MMSAVSLFKPSLVVLALAFVCVLTNLAAAGDLSIDDQREAKAFCHEFAQAVTSNADQCKAMGKALDELIEKRSELLTRVAGMDDAMVKEECNVVLAAAGDALLACFEEPSVVTALAKLKKIDAHSQRSTAPAAPSADPAAIEAWSGFCTELKSTVDTFDAKQPKCAEYATALSKVADEHQTVLQQYEMFTDQASAGLNRAMATCMEAFMAMPQACAEDEAFVKAMQRLVPSPKP